MYTIFPYMTKWKIVWLLGVGVQWGWAICALFFIRCTSWKLRCKCVLTKKSARQLQGLWFIKMCYYYSPLSWLLLYCPPILLYSHRRQHLEPIALATESFKNQGRDGSKGIIPQLHLQYKDGQSCHCGQSWEPSIFSGKWFSVEPKCSGVHQRCVPLTFYTVMSW